MSMESTSSPASPMIRKAVILAVLFSFFVGGIAGGVAGYAAAVFSQSSALSFLPAVLRVPRKPSLPAPLDTSKDQQEFQQSLKGLNEDEATTAVVTRASPAVVSIIVTKDLSKLNQGSSFPSPFDDFFFQFPGFSLPRPPAPQGKQEVGGGTGFLVSADGMILTNRHVVDDEDAEYTVLLNDGKNNEARVLARDPVLDG